MTSDAILKIALPVLTTFLGGGAVQLIIALMRRRPELRKISTESDLNAVAVLEKVITQLRTDGDGYRVTVSGLEDKAARLEDRYIQAQRDFADQLRDARGENVRMATRVAQLETDLDIAQRQIAGLRARLSEGA